MSSSFHEVRFPVDISYGAVGGPGFQTSIQGLSSGAEKRNIAWAKSRGQWDVSHAQKHPAMMAKLIAFFRARRGRAYAFRFKDWMDYQCPFPGDPAPVLFTTDGATATFQLTKPYPDDVATFIREIYKPVAGTVRLFANASLTTDFAVDTTTGIVRLGTALAATTGQSIAATYEYDTPARFDTDDLKASIDSFGTQSWASIPLVETRDT